MEVVIDYEFLNWRQGLVLIKELSIAAQYVLHTIHFQSSYSMRPHGSEEKGLNWDDGIVPNDHLETALCEAIA